jgi:twitching motility two-component system response regulator PilH
VFSSVRSATVLVVEDDPQVREMYQMALTSRYQVVLAGDGLTALTIIDRELPDVIVLDLGLPRVSGWDVYRDLRARAETQRLPVIVVTGRDARDIRKDEVAAFLHKPVDPYALVAAVDQALGRIGG